MSGLVLERNDKVAFWRVPTVESLGIRVAFFQRHGGISLGSWASLNCGFNCGDQFQRVISNRQRALAAGGFGPLAPVLVRQVHGRTILPVEEAQAGQGWISDEENLPEADGLITTTPGLPLAIKTADCLPVVLIHPQAKAVAIVHAGWKGLVKGIIAEGVKKLRAIGPLAAQPLLAVLGPCIGPDHFMVTAELFDVFMALSPDIIRIQDHYGYVDLQQAAVRQLKEQGLQEDNIIRVPDCTFDKEKDYFSYRRDQGQTGRMLSMIQIGT